MGSLTEQTVLRASILITFVVAASGIVFGLLSGSFSIAFDVCSRWPMPP
jgi:predicted Co/Zn/Cd cation transporter (cation efflux family)